MPNVNLPPEVAQVFRRLVHRIEDLERKTNRPGRSKDEEVAVFSVVGDMTVSASGPYRARVGGQVVAVNFAAAAVGSGDTEFDVLVDGGSVGSVTVPDGSTIQSDHLGNVRVSAGSTVQVEVTAAGMHEGAVIQVVMKG